MTHAEWSRALAIVTHVLREPGALPERSVTLLRVGVIPQLEAAIAMLGLPDETVYRWNAFLPAAVAAVGADPELARAERHLRSGLHALSGAASTPR
jgi:hypothetical protein